MIIGSEEDYRQAQLRARELRRALWDTPAEDVSRRNDILITLENIARAVEEYDEVIEWERSQGDNLSVEAVRAGPRGYLLPRGTSPK